MRAAPGARPARRTRLSMRKLLCILAMIAAAGLNACGQVGPLYLPDQKPAADSRATKAETPPLDNSDQSVNP